MVERLSARELFAEMLRKQLKELGIDFYLIDQEYLKSIMQVKSNSVEINIPNGIPIKIREPDFVKAAKLADLEESTPEVEYQQRNKLLLELYGKEVIYKGQNANWLKFQRNYAFAPTSELEDKVKRLDEENRTYLTRFKQHMGFAIYKMLSNKLPYADFEDCLYNMSEEEALNLLAGLSMRSRPTVAFSHVDDRIILVPYVRENLGTR